MYTFIIHRDGAAGTRLEREGEAVTAQAIESSQIVTKLLEHFQEKMCYVLSARVHVSHRVDLLHIAFEALHYNLQQQWQKIQIGKKKRHREGVLKLEKVCTTSVLLYTYTYTYIYIHMCT